MKKTLLIIIAVQLSTLLYAQEEIPLFTGKIPLSKDAVIAETSVSGDDGRPRIMKVSKPTLTVYLPEKSKANGTAVVICPGGGYVRLSIYHEGHDVAKMFNDMGVAAFVLKYRLPDESIMEHKEIGPLQDAQRAIQLVRLRAKEWNVNPNKVGVIGFSAGGHLAATLGTHFKKAYIPNKENISLRPDFMILMYSPVSQMDSLVRSHKTLLGENASEEMVREFSNELHVTRETPPTFLVQALDDPSVNPKNSIYFYRELQKNKVRSELHLYPAGGHGFGLHNKMSQEKWTDWMKVWMKEYL